MRARLILFFLLGVVLESVAAYGATQGPLSCAPYPAVFGNGIGGPSAVSCPAFSVPGGTLTAVALSYSADYQFGSNPGPNTVLVTFVPGGPGGVTWSLPTRTLTVTGGPSSGAIPTDTNTAASGISAAAFSAAFNVNVSSAVSAGTVATSSGAVTVTYTYDPPPQLNLNCPASTGTVGQPYSGALIATGGVPGYTYSIIVGALPPVLLLNGGSGLITGTPTVAGTFNFTAQVVDSIGGVAGTATKACSIVIGDIPPPPPNVCTTAAAGVIYPLEDRVPENSFLVRYAANLNQGDSYINVTNSGLLGAPPLGPGFGSSVGNVCVNVYTFSPDEQLVSCCSCLVTPNGLASFSVNNDLLKTTLTGVIPTSVVVKLVGSVPETGALAGGMLAWGTTVHAGAPPAGTMQLSETPFRPASLTQSELLSIRSRCATILGNGSGFGVCRSCRTGALGSANHQ